MSAARAHRSRRRRPGRRRARRAGAARGDAVDPPAGRPGSRSRSSSPRAPRAPSQARPLPEMVEALLLTCRLEVTSDLAGPIRDDGDGRFRVTLAPALDQTDRRQFRGCLEDWTIDHLLVDVVSLRGHRGRIVAVAAGSPPPPPMTVGRVHAAHHGSSLAAIVVSAPRRRRSRRLAVLGRADHEVDGRPRTPALNDVVRRISFLGSTKSSSWCRVLAAALRWRRCPRLAIAIVIVAIARPLAEAGLKELVGRERPAGDRLVRGRGYSFPSGHPLATAASWGMLPWSSGCTPADGRSGGPWPSASGRSPSSSPPVASGSASTGPLTSSPAPPWPCWGSP